MARTFSPPTIADTAVSMTTLQRQPLAVLIPRRGVIGELGAFLRAPLGVERTHPLAAWNATGVLRVSGSGKQKPPAAWPGVE
jgi:hypothetical protein